MHLGVFELLLFIGILAVPVGAGVAIVWAASKGPRCPLCRSRIARGARVCATCKRELPGPA